MRMIDVTLTELQIALVCMVMAHGCVYLAEHQDDPEMKDYSIRAIVGEVDEVMEKLQGFAYPKLPDDG